MKDTETIFGLHAVRAMLERHPQRVRRCTLPSSAMIRGCASYRPRAAAELEVSRLDAQALKQMLGDVAHQGVAADIAPLPPWTEDDLLGALQDEKTPLLLALDGVQDPHNLGACLRTADACGALAVIVPRDRAAQLTPTVRKVAVGAAETTPVVAVTNLVRTLKLLKDARLWVVGADAGGRQRRARSGPQRARSPGAGGRGRGTAPPDAAELRFPGAAAAAGRGREPERSVAAGMLLYEAVRQRGSA